MQFLRLNISHVCNFSCKYCHVFKISKSQVPIMVMDQKTIDLSITRYTQIMRNCGLKKLKLSIYGGEPLVNKKNLFWAIEKFGQTYNGIGIDWVLNTNGSMMTEKDAKFLKMHDIDVHLSVDGWEKTHNKNRIDKSGHGTFNRVKKALELIKENSIKAQINSFIFPENQNKLHELIEVAEQYGISRFYLDFFYSNDPSKNTEAADRACEFVMGCRKRAFTAGGPWSGILFNYINRSKNNRYAPGDYKRILPNVEVYADGKFWTNQYSSRKFPLDMLKQSFLSRENRRIASDIKRLKEKYCRYCFLGRVCNASMIWQYRYHTGHIDGHRHICNMTRKVIKNLAR